MSKAEKFADIASKNISSAHKEIEDYTFNILKDHWYDNLENLIEEATKRGFVGIEWIDFWGQGSIDTDTTIKWANTAIKHQELQNVIEPYYNNINHRLGLVLKRNVLQEKGLLKNGNFMSLPMEIQKKK